MMFVLQSTHDSLKNRHKDLANKYDSLLSKHESLMSEWNELVAFINYKGGQKFLDHASIALPVQYQFTQDELRSLLQLVYPDKHGGKESAIRLTQKINELRN